jgi:hypothetical protein
VASVNKWPNSGDFLPITFDLTKPDRLIVHWDRLTTGGDQTQAAAQALADHMRASSNASASASQPAARSEPEPSIHDEADLLAPGPAGFAGAAMDPAGLSALTALLESSAGTVVRLDAKDPQTAALREALLHAAGQVETPTATGPTTAQPSWPDADS